jgi:polysaccharide export outer membrane protein
MFRDEILRSLSGMCFLPVGDHAGRSCPATSDPLQISGFLIVSPSANGFQVMTASRLATTSWFLMSVMIGLLGCQQLPPPPDLTEEEMLSAPEYVIAPLDKVQIFVWRAPDLSVTVPVRPDGRITMPLIEDMQAAGKTPTVLARDIEEAIRPYVQEPQATVVVEGFAAQAGQMVKVIGEVARPVTVHYQIHMSVLDVMAEAQGLAEYADGNNAKLIRKQDGLEQTYRLRLKDLLHDGEMSANAKVRPGDLIVVPKSLL